MIFLMICIFKIVNIRIYLANIDKISYNNYVYLIKNTQNCHNWYIDLCFIYDILINNVLIFPIHVISIILIFNLSDFKGGGEGVPTFPESQTKVWLSK